MARKKDYIPPNESSFVSETYAMLNLVSHLQHWVEYKDRQSLTHSNSIDGKYAIGIYGFIIKGWGLSELSKWTYEMVRDWIPTVRKLERLGIIEIKPTKHLPSHDQAERYHVVIPNLQNLANAEAIIRARNN
jgi:hypothetical protein